MRLLEAALHTGKSSRECLKRRIKAGLGVPEMEERFSAHPLVNPYEQVGREIAG